MVVTDPAQGKRPNPVRRTIVAGLILGALVAVVYVGFNWQRWLMPARVVILNGTTWQLVSVDGTPVANAKATMSFSGIRATSGNGATSANRATLNSECGSRTFGYDWDSDDIGIEFWPLSTDAKRCPDGAAHDEQRVVTALPLTDHWGVDTDASIHLKGVSTIELRRSTAK